MATWHQQIWRLLELHEGRRLKPYVDTVGKISLGVGRNLTDNGISDDEADLFLMHDIETAMSELDLRVPWWRDLDEVRRAVVLDLRFNLGWPRLRQFRRMLTTLDAGEYDAAAAHLLDSRYATQVQTRATRLAGMLRTGAWPPELEA